MSYHSLVLLIAKSRGSKKVIEAVNCEGHAPLHLAVARNSIGIVKALLKFKANPNVQSAELKQTPLHLAFQFGHYEICRTLMASGSSIGMQDKEGNTPVHIAYQNRRLHSNRASSNVFPDMQTAPGYKEVMHIRNNKGFTPTQLLNDDLKEVIKRFAFEPVTKKMCSTVKAGRLGRHIAQCREHEKSRKLRKRCYSTNNTTAKSFKTVESAPAKKQGLEAYNALRLLGKGSFGEVYLVIENKSKRLYAMKVFKKEKYLSQNIIRYALTEKNIMAHMKHPFIVGLHAAFQTKRQLYLIMEYCPGGDLAFVLKKEGRFSEDKARVCIAEVILAIEHLHASNIIFRDLKPENIVLGKDGHAKLTDFGLSKEGMTDTSVTRSFCGSLAYLAPEILAKSGHGKAVDCYLVGAVLYEMLVGQPPYYSKNRKQLFFNIVNGRLIMPRHLSEEAKDLMISVRVWDKE
eukprot:TRINITY_DN4221_c0_g2_i2.p1 TRINITY_DN4221_c0_g2~~TRINITY_DN4221_c0_g2_i2.p1  ORF type:complete len:459 (+),score=87.04 TRINITY_DN4221_c0_g2_i2:583-1959(+)